MEDSQELAASHLTSQETGVPAKTESKMSRREKVRKYLARVLVFISIMLNTAMLAIGIWGIHKCPVENIIPVFMIGAGAILLLAKSISVVPRALNKHTKKIIYAELAFYSIATVFLIIGSYWVFKEYKPSYDPTDHLRYCNKTVYLFAFSYLIIFYTLLGILLIFFLGFVLCISLFGAPSVFYN